MPKATLEADTFLKKRLVGSEELADSEKLFMTKGSSFYVVDFAPDRNQHLYLKLASPLKAQDGKTELDAVYAYDPHITIEGEEAKQVIKINVPYFSQLGNEQITAFGKFWYDWRQCNTTSNTMLADFLLKGELSKMAKDQKRSEPESVYMRLVAKYGDTTDSDAQTKALKDIGIDSYFSRTLSPKDIMLSLRAGIPMVIGVAYKDAGHYCVIVGNDPVKKIWLVHDPYGTRHGYSNSYDIGIGGKFDAYTYDTMQKVLWDLGGEKGWGRIVTAIKGKPTGLPGNL